MDDPDSIDPEEKKALLYLFAIYRVVCSTGKTLSDLSNLPDWEVQMYLAIEDAKRRKFQKIKADFGTSQKSADKVNAFLLSIICEWWMI